MQDRVYAAVNEPISGSFEFRADIVEAFDDMVARSVPHYAALQSLIAEVGLAGLKSATIYDLGCSTGNTLSNFAQHAQIPIKLIGLDSSVEMIERCAINTHSLIEAGVLKLVNADLTDVEELPCGKADIVVLSLVLQFIRPLQRPSLMRMIERSMRPGGRLIVLEKTCDSSPIVNNMFITLYHRFKSNNGYSDLEIAKKREAIENRLVPYSVIENARLIEDAGFVDCTPFFSWLNFTAFIAFKPKDTLI